MPTKPRPLPIHYVIVDLQTRRIVSKPYTRANRVLAQGRAAKMDRDAGQRRFAARPVYAAERAA
jgi:hypothetical protein